MHRYFFATKDTFINSGSDFVDGTTFQDKNVGQDEVLELKKVYHNRQFKFPTRLLVQFDTSEVKNYLTSSNVPGDYKLYLRLYETAGTSGLSEEYTIAAYPISESWDEGIGREGDNPKTTIGCSWLNRENDGSNIAEVTWSNAGGTYIAGDEVTQSFSSESPDIEMDVTSMAKKWFSGENKNYGMLLRFSGSTEIGMTTSSSISNVVSSSIQQSVIGTAAGDGSLLAHVVTVQNIGQFNGYGSTNKYVINGTVTGSVNLLSGNVYRFYQQDGSNGSHPFVFSTTNQASGVNATPYTTGVRVVGVPGNTGAFTEITASDSTPTLYYYCANHGGMGGSGKLVDGVAEGRVTTATSSLSVSSSISSSITGTTTTTFTDGNAGAEELKFFSRQTNTIYSPKLELRWDDHVAASGSNTGSLTPLDLTGNVENYVYPLHNKGAYKETETVKFRFGARKRYIDKSFSTSIQTVSGSYFAEGSASYSIIDMATNEDVVPFSQYTTMSCDPISPYFKQDLNAFEPNRAYKILLKVKHDDNQTMIYDDDFEFVLRV